MERISSYERYSAVRDRKGFTDYRVAKESGVAQSTLSNWKHMKIEPKLSTYQKIADVLGCPVEELLGLRPKYGYED